MTQRRAPDPDWGLKGVPWLLWVGLCQPVEQTGRTFPLMSIHLLPVLCNVPACALFCLCACASVHLLSMCISCVVVLPTPLGVDLGAFALSWFRGHMSVCVLGCCAVASAALSQADEARWTWVPAAGGMGGFARASASRGVQLHRPLLATGPAPANLGSSLCLCLL